MELRAASGIAVVRTRREGAVVKFATRLADGALVESVAVPMRTKEGEKERRTLCVSTQVGCRMGCAFCATARMGFKRDLAPEEIVGQVEAAAALGLMPDHLAFMGMGEPLDNFDNWLEAVRRLSWNKPSGPRAPFHFSVREMIVSTCGFVPGMDRLAALGWKRLVPALSLNAPNDEIRSRLMPVNRRWPMAALKEALLRLPLRRGVFLAEYVVIRGVNDRPEHAKELADWLRPFRACVNLIAYNRIPVPDPPDGASRQADLPDSTLGGGPGHRESRIEDRASPVLASPTAAEVERFKRWLNDEGQYARRRASKGGRIAAACGQLATEAQEGRGEGGKGE
ncbi:MAG: radical SAM protein [Planctomycetes bacterium]|nr:radical SAM protein [Planctomycetota bacterium]